MPDEARDETLSPGTAALVDLARRALGPMTDAQRTAGLVALRATMNGQRRAQGSRHAKVVFAMAAAGLACGAVVMWHRGHHAELSFRVDGAELRPGGDVEATSSERPTLRFSDGSEVSLAESARVHVHTMDDHGARVTLDEGRAQVYVVHSAETRWLFEAGPFVVTVTGTAFGLSWEREEHRLDVRLENGSVAVTGPVSDAPLALRAGQWLTVRGNDVLIRSLGSDDAGPAGSAEDARPRENPPAEGNAKLVQPSAETAAAPRDLPIRAAAANHAHRAVPAPERHWVADLAGGKFEAIVDDALNLGLETAFVDSTSDELAALADAARYTRRRDIARGALLAQRRRFPASEHARVAAFSLGRLSETEGDANAALTWFDDYLGEAPEGTFASEALGRKMTIVERLDGKDAARPLADAYLRRFPDGTYAQAARALTLRP